MTQRSSDNGYTLLDTDGIDLDGITGIHGFSIDTGDNTDAGFYAAGSFYNVVVSAITVDSQTVNFIAATFRIVAAEGTAGVPVADAVRWNNLATVALPLVPTTSGRTLDVSVGGEAGLDWANIGSPTTAQNLSGTNIDVDQVVASVSGAVGSVTGAVGSVTGNVGGNVTGSVGSVVGAVGSVTGNVGGNVTGSVGSVVGAVGSVTGAVGSVTGNVGGNVTGSVGSVVGNVGGNVVGSVASVTAGVTVTTNNDKTGYALSATGSAALTESYAADGAAFTLNQGIYMIWSLLAERSISSTTLTAGKLDGTAAMTFTMDSATTPNTQTRAT